MGAVSSTIKLIDNMSSVLTKIGGNVDELAKKLGAVGDQQSTFDNFSFDTFIENAKNAGKQIAQIGKQMSMSLTLPIVTAGKKSYDAYKEHEAAYTGMTKTVEGTTEQYERLNQVVTELSETTPMTYTELMGVAQTGGNLGVKIDEMEAFVRGFAQLQYATDKHVAGEAGAQMVADFLNITEGGVGKIDQFGSALVHLGNNFNATEDQILGMGTRMAAAGHLAGLSSAQILGMAAAFRSVGIKEEAGGSAASKLIKQMQLAAEVGGNAQDLLKNAVPDMDFNSGMAFSNYLDSLGKKDLVGLAKKMNMTTEAVQSMGDSWLLLDQFAAASGKTSKQFIEDWNKDPASAMAGFFKGLSQLGETGDDSILATLDKMGLTEIRESNLIAAMASNPDLFASAIASAMGAYGENAAMIEEFVKQMQTTEAQDQMLMNQIENTTAQFGDNVARAIEPAKKAINDLLKAFNGLSEVDQDKIVKLMGALALGGPALMMLGGTVTMVSNLAKALKTIAGLGGLGGALSGGTKAATAATATKGGGWLGKMFASGTAKAVGGGFAFISTLFENALKPQGNDDLEAWFGSQEDYDQAAQRVLEENRNRTASNPSESPMVQAMQSIYGLYSQYGEGWVQAPGFENVMNQANQAFALNIDLLDSYIDKMEQTGNIDWLTTSASDAASATVESTSSVMNEGTGSEIGANFDAGIAGAISSGASSVISAAVSMVQQAIAAANAAAGIHSPSRETYWSGEMLIKGYVNAIRKGGSEVRSTMVAVMDNANRAVQSGAWKGIDYFAGLEQSQLQNPDSDIKVSDADIKKIRTLAEREAINKFTTAQIKVAFGGITNNVNKNMDLDEMMTYIEDRVSERLEAAAEGVYS